MQEPKSVTVTIFGQSYTLKGGADPGYVQDIAAFVDERMQEVAQNSAVGSTSKVAILAAVNIADELFREQKKRIEAMATLEDRSVQIARLLAQEMLPAKEANGADEGEDLSSSLEGDSLPGT